MKMTTTKIAALAALAALVITSCDLLLGLDSVDAQGRIDAFQTALNNDNPAGLQENFHPDDTTQYDAMANATFFDTSPLSSTNAPFTVSLSITDNGDGTYTATGTITNGFSASFTTTAELADYGLSDVRIVSLSMDNGGGTTLDILTLP